jgi:branched-chain amino acid transport system permease protein
VSIGALYGLLAFANVVLFKATGTVNFATGIMATLCAFIAWRFTSNHELGTIPAVALAIAGSVALGGIVYAVVGARNARNPTALLVRTLAVDLVLVALINRFYAIGQPYEFPSLLSSGGVTVGGTLISYATFEVIGICIVLTALFMVFFRYTRAGLLTRAMADNRDVATLLGVPTRRLAALAWAIASVIGAVVALVSANQLLLSTNMLDDFVLYAFTGAIIFGLTSLSGAIIGGIAIGVITNVVATYQSADWSLIVIFCALIAVLIVRPQGLLGHAAVRRV